jgi:hypothetical protein
LHLLACFEKKHRSQQRYYLNVVDLLVSEFPVHTLYIAMMPVIVKV